MKTITNNSLYFTVFLLLISILSFGQAWEKTYGGSNNEICSIVQQTTDGGYILGGYTNSTNNGNSDMYLIKTDSIGDTLWTKSYGGNGYEVCTSIQQTTDGGFILGGTTKASHDAINDIYLIKTDGNGNIVFVNEIPTPNPNRKLIKLIDISGKEITYPKNHQAYIEVYDDGSIEKKVVFE